MAGGTVSVAEATDAKTQDRQRSTIQFPYADLKSAIELLRLSTGMQVWGKADDDQLAAWTNQSAKSSGFRVQVAAARMFGLLSGEGRKNRLSDLGRSVVGPNQNRAAKSQAFLNILLYKLVYDTYRSGVLPSQAAALERDMVGMGVGAKFKDRARQVFERSAEQACFFEHGKNRLVMPAAGIGAREVKEEPEVKKKNGSGSGGDLDLDPLLIALLKKIPPSVDEWPGPQRVRWFRTFAMNVSQIYDGDGEPAEMKIDLEK